MLIPAILIVVALIARCMGAAGVAFLDSWPAAIRLGLAVMFLVTASAHFNALRHDLARMVPPWVPRPMAMIHFTGICEILGAVGLLLPGTRIYAAGALALFLIAVLPANVHAARTGATLRGKPVTSLMVRIPMQMLFIALMVWAGIVDPR
jgi:uncharacterized membrane protein